MNFVPKGPIDNISALVQIMDWLRTWGIDAPLGLSESRQVLRWRGFPEFKMKNRYTHMLVVMNKRNFNPFDIDNQQNGLT